MIHRLALLILAVGVAGCSSPRTARTVLEEAQAAMGGDVDTIQFTAVGVNGWVGQALLAGEAWPRRAVTGYSRRINYAQRSSSEETTFAEAVFGGQRQNAHVSGDKAWNLGANGPVPQLAAADERQLFILMTPHGFLREALAAGSPTLAEGSDVISFQALDKYTLLGTLDDQRHVTRVETTLPNPVLGDLPTVAEYFDYQDFGGVAFPRKMVVTQGGFTLWELNITGVQPNAPFDLPVPPAVAAATIPPVQTASTKLADGVWFVGGGSHHSVVVEFGDHLAVVEAPLGEERSMAVLAEAKKLAPGKPVRYLLTTHHHFDHTGGFRTYVAEGATIVTHQSNVAYFEKAATAPATIAPDAQSASRKTPAMLGVADKQTLTDGRQTIEIYASGGDGHTGEYTLIYLPRPGILVEADAFSPGPPDAPPPAVAPPSAVALYDDIQRLKLNVKTIAPIHGRGPVSIAELRRAIGRS